MSGLDVEALLESTAAPDEAPRKSEDRDERHDRDRSRDRRRRRDRSRDRRRDRDADGDEDMKSPRSEQGSANGSHRSRKRSRSRESDRRRRRDRPGDDYRSSGDFYRGGGRAPTRSRSPRDDRHYRPSRREREDEKRPRRERDGRRRSPSKSPGLNEDERDKRTIFVQQLAARLRTKELMAFFEKVGPVKEAQIVKDRVSGRSKGYVLLYPSPSFQGSVEAANMHLVSVTSSSEAKSPCLPPFSSPARSF